MTNPASVVTDNAIPVRHKVLDDLHHLLALHGVLMKTESKAYAAKLRWAVTPFLLSLVFLAVACIRFLDGLVARYAFDSAVESNQLFLTGIIFLVLAVILRIISRAALARTRQALDAVFHEINEDIRWMKKLI